MLKRFILCLFLTCSYWSVTTQNEFNIGIAAALPIGDANNFASFALAADANYLFQTSEYLKLGPFTSLSYTFGDRIDGEQFEDVLFLPVGGAGRFELLPRILLGLDMGYAVPLNEGFSGGFYFSPRAQVGLTDRLDVVVAYRGITRSGLSWDMIGIGVEYSLK